MCKARLRSALFLGGAVVILCAHGQDAAESALEATKPPIINSVVQDATPAEIPVTDEVPPAAPTAADRQSEASDFTDEQLIEFDRAYNASSSDVGSETAQDVPSATPSTSQRMWEVIAVLLFLCAVIILLGYAVRRFGKRTPFLAGADLGSVLGKVYLNPRASLHYVKSGGRILVLGVTQNNVQLITEFDETDFGGAGEEGRLSSSEATAGSSFLQELQSRVEGAERERPRLHETDESIASLRGELQRLQQHLGKSTREPDA